MVIMFLSCGAHATGCETVEEMDTADAAASKIHDWAGANSFYSHFRQCDDGYISEGISATVTKLLAHEWGTLDRLEKITNKDNNFKLWVLNHIDTTADGGDLELIIHNAGEKCTEDSKNLCEKIGNAANQALQELKE